MRTVACILIFLIPFFVSGQTSSYYFNTGELQCEIIQLEDVIDAHRHIIYYHKNGEKEKEFFDKNRVKYDTLNKWTEDGELHCRHMYTDTGYMEVNYWYDVGQILSIGSYTFTATPLVHKDVYDSTNFDKYTTSECDQPCYTRTGVWKTYHPNGALKSEGKYLPMQFESSWPTRKDSSTGALGAVANTSFEMEPDVIYLLCSSFLKDGLWSYYNEKGDPIKNEEYANGLLKK